MAAISRERPMRMAPMVGFGAAEGEDSSGDSEDADKNGGAAACAAACRIEEIGDELQELQDRIADLVVERRELRQHCSYDHQPAIVATMRADAPIDTDSGIDSDDGDAEGSVSAVQFS